MARRWILLALVTAALMAVGCPEDDGDDDSAVSDDDDVGDDDSAGDDDDPWAEAAAWELSEPIPCPPEVPDDDALVQLLGELGLDLTVGIDWFYYDNYGGYIEEDPARLDFFHDLQEDVTLIPCTAEGYALRADAAADSDHRLATQIADMAAELGLTVEAGGEFAALDGEEPLVAALAELFGDDENWDADTAAADAAALPLELRSLAGWLVRAAAEASETRDDALDAWLGVWDAGMMFERVPHTYISSMGQGMNPDDEDDLAVLVPDDAAAAAMYTGAIRLAQALDEAPWIEALDDDFEFFVDTPRGVVLIRGGGDDVYDPTVDERLDAPLLLVIDAGGSDTYRIPAGATSSEDNGVALCVDLGGDDAYGYVEEADPNDLEGLLPSDEDGRYHGDGFYGPITDSNFPRQGAGVGGYGFLLDLGGGDDVYRSLRFSQGFAAVGVGVLYDDGGADDYECESSCQASSLAGLALLHDGGGPDRYRAFYSSQAFASPMAFALLYEHEGADTYELEPDDPFMYGWYEGYPHNISRGQGAATGLRQGDYVNEVHLGGGIGLLRDREGDDEYLASVMAQANGYWFGFGILADGAGNDRYNGYNYIQGATEHFALAAFVEGGGDDTYNDELEPTHSSIALAHDYSVTVFVERDGHDWYHGPDRGIGTSKCHGLGILVDHLGDDEYHAWDDRSIGWATDYDWDVGTCGDATTIPSYGFFVDLDGADLYDKPDPTGYGDDTVWLTDDPHDDTAMELSGGIDVTGGACVL